MRLDRPVNFGALDYYNNQRLVSIQKSRRPLQQTLQRIANEVIDDFVFTYHTSISDSSIDKSNPNYYRNKILNLNEADTRRAFSRLLDKSILRKDTYNKIAANIHANKVATILTNTEVERIQKNILWADHIISNSEFQLDTYQRLVEKMRPTSSRKLMLEKSIKEGTSISGREYTYKELKNVSRDLEKYKTNSLDMETRNMENSQAIRDGGDMIHTSKTWVWSMLENTRHSLMDNQTVNLNGKFEVINEVTGDVDFLLFPGDIDNDDHNCSNICNCYDKYTEFFTLDGFKRVDQITMNDTFLSFNPETLEPCWLKPTKIIKNRFKGYLNHIHTSNFDLKVTDDHEMYIHYGRHYKPLFRPVKDLKWNNCFVRTIDYHKTGINMVDVNGLLFNADDYAFFMAWYLSEGSVLHDERSARRKGYPVVISQCKKDNRELIIKIFKKISDYLGIKLYIGKTNIEFRSKQLYDYLLPLGYSYEKYIPDEIFQLNTDCLNIFLENFIKGDGSIDNNGTKRIYSSSKRLLDGLSYVSLLCGYYPNYSVCSHKGDVVEHRNGVYTQNYDVGCLTLGKTHYTNYRPKCHDKIYYDDYVYCCELPKYHTLWVRSNGKTFIGSNCQCSVIYE